MARYRNKISSITATCLGKPPPCQEIINKQTTNFDQSLERTSMLTSDVKSQQDLQKAGSHSVVDLDLEHSKFRVAKIVPYQKNSGSAQVSGHQSTSINHQQIVKKSSKVLNNFRSSDQLNDKSSTSCIYNYNYHGLPKIETNGHTDYLSTGDSVNQSAAYAAYHMNEQAKNSNNLIVATMSTSSNVSRNNNIYLNKTLQKSKPTIKGNSVAATINKNFSKKANFSEDFIKKKTKKSADGRNWAKVLPPYRVQEDLSDQDQIQQEQHKQHKQDDLPQNIIKEHQNNNHESEIRNRTSKFRSFADKVKFGSRFMKQSNNILDDPDPNTQNQSQNADEYPMSINNKKSWPFNLSTARKVDNLNENARLWRNFYSGNKFRSKELTFPLWRLRIHWPSVLVTLIFFAVLIVCGGYFFIKSDKLLGSCLRIFKIGKSYECACSTCGNS